MPDGLKRLHHSGQSHFLTFSCYHRLPLLAQMQMQEAFLLALEQTRRRFQMRVYGYVVMPEPVKKAKESREDYLSGRLVITITM